MSQMLLPLANLATEIMNEWKGRLRAVAVINRSGRDEEGGESSDDEDENFQIGDSVDILLGWKEVPYMRELLRVRLLSLPCLLPLPSIFTY